MKQIYTILLVSSLALFASACSYFDRTDGEGVTVEHYGTSTNTGVREYAGELPESYGRDVALHTQGRVEVFDLNGGGADEIVASTVGVQDAGSAGGEMVRPSVEIYPAGGSAVAPSYEPYRQHAAQAGAYTEPLVVYFEYNSSRLGSGDWAAISDFASLYRGGVTPTISVEGHASPEAGSYGGNLGNMKVSLDRSNAVAKALVESGVPADKITVQAFGAKRIAPSFMRGGRDVDASSQRVEVHVR